MASTPSPRERHTGRNVAIVLVVILLIAVVLLVVPIPHSVPYSFTISNPGSTTTYYQTQSLSPVGASVSVNFTVISGSTITFSIIDPNGATVWSHGGDSGATTFTLQTSGTYKFGAYDWLASTVSVSVTVSSNSPMLPI